MNTVTLNSTQDWRSRATITVEEAGEILGVSRASAYAAARSSDLETIRVGKRILVPVPKLRRLLGELD
jgi:excisionase family DNA binding protein